MTTDTLFYTLSLSLFGNELWRYVTFILLLILAWATSKIANYIINCRVAKLVEKTKWQFDDVLIKSIKLPIPMFILATFLHFGSNFIVWGSHTFFEKVLRLLFIIPLVYFLIRFSTEFTKKYFKGTKKYRTLNAAAVDILISIIRTLLIAIGVLVIMSNLGYDITTLLASLGIGGLVFALAAQDLLKNFFAGIALIFDKTFGKGEKVKFQGRSGIIEEIKLRSTKLRTYDGTLLTIPNAMLSNNIVENVSKIPKVKVSMTIGVTYDTSIAKLKKAKEIIKESIKNEKHADDKSARVYFDNFGAYSLDIKVIYYSLDLTMSDWPKRVYMKERINFEIKEEFEKAGINMAFPTQTLDIPELEDLKRKK